LAYCRAMGPDTVRRFFRSAAFPILIVVVLAFFAQRLISPGSGTETPDYNTFVQRIDQGQIESVTWNTKDNSLNVKQVDGTSYDESFPDSDSAQAELLNNLQQHNVKTEIKGKGGSSLLSLLTYILPFLLFFAFWIFLMNQMQGGGSRVMSFGKSRAKRMSVDAPKITFRDVAGADEAVQELHEIKEFLENPKKFQALGARIPKGVLLYGPPGTGKTLLARAVAGEAGVPFFSISGSDFVEMFVGVGASRVRDLFEQAKQNSPCIIFMDEIDAVGRHRGAGMGGGHDEREQTLNQLLVEMDGFEMKDNIILIAATNRPDILDPALLRPGRFDRQIVVDRPDRKGRKQILEVHTRGKPLAQEIDLDALAGQTPGFTGADLANLINEAALLTARGNKREITMLELEEGIMRVIAGPEKKSRVMSEKERLITAYHELGHAIVGHLLPNSDPVHKVSIISRGQALGYTISLPTEDKFLTTRAELNDTMAMTLGGRAAEEIVFGEITTGASNDLEKVTETAKQMVMRFGMSERLGPRVFGHDRSQPFLGREFSAEPDYSDEVAREIDDEVRRMVEDAHQTSKDILSERREQLDTISRILLARETIEAEEFIALLEGKPEDEVFTDEEEAQPPEAPPVEEKGTAREGARPRPHPRPGLAGGGAEMRANDPKR
jgi:cell division protease FtsH